jgi:hypothetical protein
MTGIPSVVGVMAAALTAHQDRHGTDAVDARVLKAAIEAHGSLHTRRPVSDAIPNAVPGLRRMAKEAATDQPPVTKYAWPDRLLVPAVNPAGGRAPPLTIAKRYTPPKEAGMSTFNDLLKAATVLTDNDDLEGANRALNKAERMIAKAYDDDDEEDENNFDSPSDPSGDDEDEDDDDNGNGLKKWSTDYSYDGYGGTAAPRQPTTTRQGLPQVGDTYNVSTTATTAVPLRSRFDSRVDFICQRDGVSRSVAMTRARTEFPTDYVQHQSYIAESPTNEQVMQRFPVGSQSNKRAPADYESLCAEQIAKGCSPTLAAQRVCQLYGYPAFNNRAMSALAKGQDIETRFRRIAKRIADEEGLPLEEATRKARLRNPSLFKALQSV